MRFPLSRARRILPVVAVAASSLLLEACRGCREEPDPIVTDPPVEDPHDIGQYLSVRNMPDGRPAMAYYDRTKGALSFSLGTVQGETISWAEERVDGFTNEQGLDVGDRGKYASLAVAGDGTAWISYYDATNGNLFYARRAGKDNWTTGIADTGGGATPNAGLFSSIALDSSGNPVIAHYDKNKGQLRVTHWRDTSFSGEVVDEGTDYTPEEGSEEEARDANVGQYARLLIHEGTEYIAYYDQANGDLKLAVGSSGSYSIETVDSTGDVGAWPAIFIDNGTVHIAYQDLTNYDLKLASGRPEDWTLSTLDDGDFVGSDSEIFVEGGALHILYFDGNENNLKLARQDGGSWTSDTVGGADAALGFHNETVNVDGKRYAACYDYTNRTIWFEELAL